MSLISQIKRSNPSLKRKNIRKVLEYLGYSKNDMECENPPSRSIGVLFFFLPSKYIENERFKKKKKDNWE